jgi:glucose-6-phosphate dehydrogenase assembly protein OpcA
MHSHPNRTIVLRVAEAGPVEARTSIQCWMPFGRHQQVCCEQIEIEAPRQALEEVPPVLLGLMVADLPVAVWCRDPRLAALPELAPILRLAGKVIVDSGTLPLSEALPALRLLSKGPWRLADLAWARITGARQRLAVPPDATGRAYFDAWLGARPAFAAALPPVDDAELLREELGICGRDPQFEAVLAALL